MRDVVIGVDASTTAVKAIAFTADGAVLQESRAAYPLSTPHAGQAEQNAEDWWSALSRALKELTAEVLPSRIAGIAITHQRETFVLIDRNGNPIRPAILWIDERSRNEVAELTERFGRDRINEWSGKPPDPTPGLYGLAWLRKHEPNSLVGTDFVADTGTYLQFRLTGARTASLASADPLGMVDLSARSWRAELVEAAGLSENQLPSLVLPGTEVGRVDNQAADRCGLEVGTPVYAAVGDGQANGLGLGIVGEGSACLSLGSGVVFGMYSKKYTHSDAYRVLTAADGRGFMFETVLRSGMQLLEWVLRTTNASTAGDMEKHALDIPPGSEGLLMLPYFSGVMNPWWDENARGVLAGLSLSHTPAHIYRAAIEAIAFEQAIATHAMEESLGTRATSLVASGGGTNSRLIMRCLTAILERPIAISPVKEAAALGAAMLAAIGAGWFKTTGEAAASMCPRPEAPLEPDAALVDAYRPYRGIYANLYRSMQPVHAALADLARRED